MKDLSFRAADAGDESAIQKETWESNSFSSHPHYLTLLTKDLRRRLRLILALSSGRPVAAISVMTSHSSAVLDRSLADAGITAGIIDFQVPDAAGICHIGNPVDFSAAVAFASDVDELDRFELSARLVAHVASSARGNGLAVSAQWIREADIDMFRSAMGTHHVYSMDDYYCLPIAAASLSEHIENQRHSVRATIRRDRRRFASSGLVARSVQAATFTQNAARLIAKVKENNGVNEHPRLIEYRLARWVSAAGDRAVAFQVSNAANDLLAASFGVWNGSALDMYEVGVDGHADLRHSAYLEALIDAPLQYAIYRKASELGLGTLSRTPKLLRGARPLPTWGILA